MDKIYINFKWERTDASKNNFNKMKIREIPYKKIIVSKLC